MKGTRPLTADEIRIVAQQFEGTFAIRNRSLFMLVGYSSVEEQGEQVA